MDGTDATAPELSGEEATEESNSETQQLFRCAPTPDMSHLSGWTLATLITPPAIYLLAYSDDHAREIACNLVDPTKMWDYPPFVWKVEPVPTAIEVQ